MTQFSKNAKNQKAASEEMAFGDSNEIHGVGTGSIFSLASCYILSTPIVNKFSAEPVKGFAPFESGLPMPTQHFATGSTPAYQTAENKSNQSKDLRCPYIDGQCGDIASQKLI